LVLLGGLVISTLPESSWLMQLEVVRQVRGSGAGRMGALTVVVTGLGLYAAAWLALCRHVSRVEGPADTDALALVRQATVVWSVPLLLAPPLFSRDGWSYAAQGMLMQFEISPYKFGPGLLVGPIVEGVDPRWMFTPAPYGPVPLIAGDLASGVTGNPWLLVVAHRLVALAGLAMLAWAVPRMARWAGVNPALASALAIGSPLVLAHGVGGLHNDLLMVGLMAVALVVTVEHGWVAGALVGGLAAGVKLPGGLVCIGVALVALPVGATLVARLRRLAQVGAVSTGALVLPGLVAGLGVGWASALGVPGTVHTPLSMTTNVGRSLGQLAEWVGLGLPEDAVLEGVRGLGSVGMVVGAAAVALVWRTGSRTDAVRAVALVMGLTVLLSPVVHLWYFLWLMPFAAALRLSRLATVAVIATSVVAGLVAPLDSSLHRAYLAIVIGSLAVAGAVLVLLLTRRSRDRIEKIATAPWVPVPRLAATEERHVA
jgi:alpha-1,6-mannosyltransferase